MIRMNKNILLFILSMSVFYIFSLESNAEEAPSSIPLDNIFVTPAGANSYVEGNNVIITDNKPDQIGSIFSTEQNTIDLTKDFYSEMYIKIDGEADGVAFVMHNDPAKITKFSGLVGEGLGIYGTQIKYPNIVMGEQLKNSFAIEFDTYHNGNGYDRGYSANDGKGHIAHVFPDKYASYTTASIPGVSGVLRITSVKHFNIQYPSFKLGDNQWRLLKLKWTAWNNQKIGTLVYTFGDLDPVTVSISRNAFKTDNVFWGFTGSTGMYFERAVVAFKSVPGLVLYDDTMEFLNDKGQKINTVTQNSEVTVHYTGNYHGGKQNLYEPTLKVTLAPEQTYQNGTCLVNGKPVTPTYKAGILNIPFNDLSLTNNKVDIKFKVKDNNIKADKKLVVKTEIKGKNFVSDQSGSYNIIYDYEAPTGAGKVSFIDLGNSSAITNAKDYSTFLSFYEDDHSPKDGIKVELKKGQNIPALVSKVGPASFKVTLTDSAGNMSDVTVPIFVQDDNVIKNGKYIIYGKDFSIEAKDYAKTTKELMAMIRLRSNAKLWKYNQASINELNQSLLEVSLENMPVPPALVSSGDYYSFISYGTGADKLSQLINVNVVPSLAVVEISFVDEKNVPILEPVSFEAYIATQIDLTKDERVRNKIREIESKNYVLDQSPTDEKSLLVLPEGVKRSYKFKGTLFIASAPNVIDFGDQEVSAKNEKYNNPSYDQPLVIWDNRSTLGEWRINLKQSSDFSIPGNSAYRLVDALSYQTVESEKKISSEAQEVFRSKHKSSGKYNISTETWGPKKQGLRLNVPIGTVKKLGNYETTLTWQIEEAY